jgi:ribosomal protein S18 acetylase RimI-like enzyme
MKELEPSGFASAESLILMFGSDDPAESDFTAPAKHYIDRMLSRDYFHVVALDGENLIGGLTAYEMKMCKRETTEMFLYEIEVAESHRRRGVVRALIES